MIKKKNKKDLKLFYIFIFGLIFITRFFLIKYYPGITGDLETNYTVAKNILSGCGVSISNLNSSECIPHFGGNQGPAYPFFVASIFYFFGENLNFVRYAQLLIFSISLIYFFRTIEKFNIENNKFKLLVIFLSLSPITFPWSRFIGADTLSLSFLLVYFSFFINSLYKNKIDIIPLSILLGAGSYFRLDFIFLSLTLLVFFYLYPSKKKFFTDGIKMFAICLLIWTPWTIRNLLKEVAIFPTHQQQQATHNSSEYYPKGMYKWLSTWMTHEYQRVGTIYNLSNKKFSQIKINHKAAFLSNTEKEEILILLEKLSDYDGKNFPISLDQKIDDIANKKIKSNYFRHYFIIPLKRIYYFWFNYKNSYGWPFEISNKLNSEMAKKNYNFSKRDIIVMAKENFVVIAGKLTVNFYRFAIFIVFFWILFKKSNDSIMRNLSFAVFIFFIIKSVFSGYLNLAETRYTLLVYPLMEFIVFSKLIGFNLSKT